MVGDRGGPLAFLEARLVLGTLAVLGALPLRAQSLVAGSVARLARRFDRRHSDAAREFMTQALGNGLSHAEREAKVLAAWRFFFTMIARSGRLDRVLRRDGFSAHFETHYGEGVREAFASKGGRILVAPHLGDFEAGAMSLAHLGLSPGYVVSRPPRNRHLSIAIQRQREGRGYRLLHRHGAMEDVSKILAANGTLVMLLDQRARRRTVIAPFFGRAAHCERAPAILMRRLGVPVITVWCEALEQPWQYRMHFTRAFKPADFASSTPEEIATALNRAMEEMILSAPEQYFWFHDRYRKAPAGDSAPPRGSPAARDPA